jgi:hypothetical protein
VKRVFSAIVIRPQVTWLAEPRNADAPEHTVTPTWAGEPAYAGDLANMADKAFGAHAEGVILLQLPTYASMNSAGRRRAGVIIVESLKAAGWQTTTQGITTGWFFCLRAGRVVMFGIGPWIEQGRTPLVSLSRSQAAPVVASRLAEYHHLVGVCWRGTGGLSGTALVRKLRTRNEPLWRWDKADTDVCGSAFELGTPHQRAPRPDELDRPVVKFDVRGMYLAAALCAEFGLEAPERRGPQEFDPARPGYWQVAAPTWLDPRGLLTRQREGRCWVTTPVMQYWADAGHRLEIYDSLTSAGQTRIMRPWSERLRDARTKAPSALVPAIKDTYSRTVGMLRRPGGRIYRPDWRDTIVDLAKVNLLRKLDAMNVDPLHFQTDAIWVATDADVPQKLFPDRGNIGALRFEELMTMDEYRNGNEA